MNVAPESSFDAPETPSISNRPFRRLGRWVGLRPRLVIGAWLAIVIIFGFFAPRAMNSLAGAGWDVSTSQSVHARHIIRTEFKGLGSSALEVVISDPHHQVSNDPHAILATNRAIRLLEQAPHVAKVVPPTPGISISRDGHVAIVEGGAGASTNTMVQVAQTLAPQLGALSGHGVTVALTGSSALWADFNSTNHSAMMHSEMLSWPVTLAILVVAFGSVVAAGLPLMLTLVGLVVAAGALVLLNSLVPISIWALNFALMFALALGIDYALFVVARFRQALATQPEGLDPKLRSIRAIEDTLDTAGKAVAFSAVTVLGSLAAIEIVPSPAFRSMALGIMLSVVAVLAATLTLLPIVLIKLGDRVNLGSIRRNRGAHPSSHPAALTYLHHFARAIWRRPIWIGTAAVAILVIAALPVFGLRTSMPSINVIGSQQNAHIGYQAVSGAFGSGALATFDVVVPTSKATVAEHQLRQLPSIDAVLPMGSNATWSLLSAVPTQGPSSADLASTLQDVRSQLPVGSLVGGAAAENLDLQSTLAHDTPIVFGLLALVGYLLLVVALRAPLIALAGVVMTGLSIGAAFGVARLIFQNGDLAGLLGFHPQGFVDAWAPLFFGAMVFGVAMDYTLFLLSVAKGHYENGADPQSATERALGTSGHVIVSAAFIMVAVFITFALSGPLAPKEMGTVLALAVLFDAAVTRLVLLPLVLRLGAHAAWHTPKWLDRMLPRVTFAH